MRRVRSFFQSQPHKGWRFFAFVVVVWVLLFRLGIWVVVSRINTQGSANHFHAVAAADLENFQHELELYANTLYAGQALFATDPTVSRQDWNTFITAQHLTDRYPGIDGVSYITAIPSSQAPTLLATLNSQRQPGEQPLTSLYPASSHGSMAVVTYVAPSTTKQSGIGYDVLSDPSRAAALTNAATSATPAATPQPIELEGEHTGLTSLLIALPVYNTQLPLDTASERQAAVKGYVAVLLHLQPLLDASLANPGPYGPVSVQVVSGNTVLYTHGPQLATPALINHATVTVGGQRWQVIFTAQRNYGLIGTATWLPPLLYISSLPLLIMCILVVYFATRYHTLKMSQPTGRR